jgi:hypothetical protein
MTNTSATGGYMVPETSPLDRAAIEELLRAAVAGITGLPGRLVRPRWQRTPAPVPHAATAWCSVGILSTGTPGIPATIHDPAGEGVDVQVLWRRLRVQCSFYGPGAFELAARLEAGFAVGQNRAALRAAGIAFSSIGEPIGAPELAGTDWVDRVDVELFFDFEERRTYPVRNLEGGRLAILTDTGQARELIIEED